MLKLIVIEIEWSPFVVQIGLKAGSVQEEGRVGHAR
jgi:hypothetical protein